jgi:hypothetical protein
MRFYEMAVAVDQHHGFKPFSRSQRCRLQSYTHLDHKFLQLSQTSLAQSLNQAIFEGYHHIHRSLSTPCLSLTTTLEEDYLVDTNPRIEIVGGHDDPRARALVVEVAIALASGVHPMPVSTGLGGAYFLRGRNGSNNIAVAKPVDEEPLAFNNPKGFGGGRMLGQPGLKRSVRIGETGVRELAAYLLDHGGFAGVPPTALVKISNVAFHVNNYEDHMADYKIASLQRFVHHKYDAGELGSSSFSVASVHRIGIFDVRLLNLDRHAGNILVKKYDNNYSELVPIDHGLCLPEWLDDPYFEWLHWPQALVPFSEYEIEYICNLDPFKDADLLRTELPSIRESSIRVFVVCTVFLKRAAAAGLCLADIGKMMTREFRCGEENFLSVIEILCAQAKGRLPDICLDDQREETRKENEIFEFDNDGEDSSTTFSEVLDDLPRLLKSHFVVAKPPVKISRFSSTGSMAAGLPDAALPPLYEENDSTFHDNYNISGSDDKHKVGGFMKSVSFSVPDNHNSETGGVSFEDMSEDEWELFLEIFEELLPDVFEGKKCTRLRQRLGTSCKF